MAAIYDLYLEQGDTFKEDVDISGDYTGFSIRSNVIDSVGATTSFTIAFTDDTAGTFTMSLTNLQTEAMSNGVGRYDIELVSPSTEVVKILKGSVYVSGETTKGA